MASLHLKPMTLDEFLAWAERQPQGRFELVHGQPVKMAAERVRHARAKMFAVNALGAAITRAGLPCEAFPDGMAVPIRGRATREPDALVNCGPKLGEDVILVHAPVIVVEVLSPSTAGTDAWDKLPNVKRLLDEINARPAAQRAEALKTSHAFKTEMDEDARKVMFPQNARLDA